MGELELLKSMWAHKVKRNTKLIVSEVTYDQGKGHLNNDHWHFQVPYAFRDALDLKYEQRMKNKKPYMVWTQGPLLRFKDGDVLTSKCGTKAVQVKYANGMGWDTAVDQMYEGSVVFESFDIKDGSYISSGEKNVTQMQFLNMVIHGENYS